jgi:ATP-binding cassette, subfamily C, bacterial CydC
VSTGFNSYLNDTTRAFARPLILAGVSAVVVSVSAVGLLGLSGWFLTAAAVAGAAGPVAAQALNYLLPSAAIRLFAILRTGFRYLERLSGHEGGLKAMARVRPHLFERLAGGQPEAVFSLSQGEASGRLIQDVGVLETAFVAKSAPAGATGALVASVGMCLMLGPLAACVCLAGLVATIVAGWRLSRFVERSNEANETADEQAAFGALKQGVFELMPLLPDMAAFDLGPTVLTQIEAQEDALKQARLRSLSFEALLVIVCSGMMALTLVAVVVISAGSPIALLALAVLSVTTGFESAAALLQVLSQRRRFAAAQMRLGDIYDIPRPKPPAAGAASQEPRLCYGDQQFKLNGDLRLCLHGPSGAGKTRLIGALMGLVDPAQVPDLRPESVFSRDLFSLCPQEAPVISGTIRDNLIMALDSRKRASLSAPQIEARLSEALADAGLTKRLASLARGLDTWVGDDGITLSGGERKRLGLARAYLRDAPVLVLDEPTEGLDAAMEAFVIERLHQRLTHSGQGLILTSHRPLPRQLTTSELLIQAVTPEARH